MIKNVDLLIKILISVLSAYFIIRSGAINNTFLILAILNSTICIFQIVSYNDYPYSLHKLTNLFILIFFVLANTVQFAHKSVVTSLWVDFQGKDYVSFQILTFIILVIYNYLYSKLIKKTVDAPQVKVFLCNNNLLIFLALLSTALLLYQYRDTPIRLFYRGLQGDAYTEAIEIEHASTLIFNKFVRVIPSACLLCSLLSNAPRGISLCLVLLSMISAFPAGLARNAIVMYWLPPILAHFKLMKRKNAFVFLMFIGFFIIFPIMDNFRLFNGEISFTFDVGYLDSMNYDSAQNFMTVIKRGIVTNGRQLLGTLLFFIPRRVWPSKPVGSGAMLAMDDMAFSNISMPFFGEGFINFGWVGVILFLFFFIWFSARLDSNYWYKIREGLSSINDGYYLLICGALTFVLRGDLLSSFSYTVGALFTYFFVSFITSRRVL